ncbi:hypothetical protein GCM10009846_19710 [Agrococcus versicolor]|uniref:SipW-cognate class signal peptide n=1 Tax=Agrococcus versicolor TaxID=501482 RepID=A0ABN3ASR0_9MICO
MGRHAAQRRSRTSQWLVRLRAVLAGGLVLGVGTTATLAAWNDSEYATTSVTSGSFGIVGAPGDPAAANAFTDHPLATPGAMTLAYTAGTALAPGQSGISRYSIRLATGSVPGTVTLQAPVVGGTVSAANTALAAQLRYSVRVVSGTVAAPATPTCSSVFAQGATGFVSVVEDQPLTTAATVSQTLVQTPSPTIQHYCVRLTLPSIGSTNDSQNASGMTVLFPFLGST